MTFEPPVYPKTLGTADLFFAESVLSRKHIQDDRSILVAIGPRCTNVGDSMYSGDFFVLNCKILLRV